MNRYRTRQVTTGRYVKQQARFYPQYQPEGDSFSWFNFQRDGLDVYFTSLADAEAYLDNAVEEEVMPPSETEIAPEEEQSDSALDEEISKLEAELETEPPEEESEDDEVLDELLSDLETAPESDESEDDELNKLIAEIETK